jgi:hypothetical protein
MEQTPTNQEEKTENIEKQECIEFVGSIKRNIADTFPFLSGEEKNIFSRKLNLLLENDEIVSNLVELTKQICLAIATLDNSHTVLRENKKEKQYGLEKPIYYKAGTFWTDTENGTFEVVSLNGVSITELVEEKRMEIGGGTDDWQIGLALEAVMTSENQSNVVIEIKNNSGEIEKMETKFSDKPKSKNRKFVESKMLSDSIGYLNVRSWSNHAQTDGKNIAELVEEELENLKDSDSLIIDVRQNGGGNSDLAEKLAGHFIDKPTQYCKILKKVPGQDELVEKTLSISPDGEFLDKKVVILTDSKGLSSNEMFILMLKDTGKAVTIGQTTGGGSGNPKAFDLRLGGNDFTLTVSTWRMARNDGRELEGVGIEPDMPVEITKDNVVQHHDVELEKAIEYLTS